MARKNPIAPMEIHQDKHDKMLSEMHSALYTLGDKIQKPSPRSGEKLLPENLRQQAPKGAKAARRHIQRIHRAMREEK